MAKPVASDLETIEKHIDITAMQSESNAFDPQSVTDLQFLKQFTEGDEATMRKYIDIYIKKTRTHLAELEGAIPDSDHQKIRLVVHTMKAHCKMMGMQSALEKGIQIEQLLGAGEKDALNDCLAEFMTLCRRSIVELEA